MKAKPSKNSRNPFESSLFQGRKIIHNLVVPFSEIPVDGADFKVEESFEELHEALPTDPENLNQIFSHPIKVQGSMTPVGSKLDVRGDFTSFANEVCDRCASDFATPIQGSITTFLMPKDQFSKHDKPGGKVIHGPKKELKKTRHHSGSKAEVLLDAEGEHEDLSFSAFDGEIVDLRPILREQMILALPMSNICSPDCKGLCLSCGENIQKGDCKCPNGPQTVPSEDQEEPMSALGAALQKKLQSESKP